MTGTTGPGIHRLSGFGQKLDRIGSDRIVYRDDRQVVLQRLRDQDAVEWVAVQWRKLGQEDERRLLNR
jgi:hypothetical protein